MPRQTRLLAAASLSYILQGRSQTDGSHGKYVSPGVSAAVAALDRKERHSVAFLEQGLVFFLVRVPQQGEMCVSLPLPPPPHGGGGGGAPQPPFPW